MSSVESKFIVVETGKKRLVVVVIYRSPSVSIVTFLKQMEEILISLPTNTPTVITGDFNDDLRVNPSSSLTRLMERYGFQQQIKQPTTDSGTLIDHIYFNKHDTDINTSVVDNYYSDHDLVCLSMTV